MSVIVPTPDEELPGDDEQERRGFPVVGAALLGLDELGERPGGAAERRLRADIERGPLPTRA